MRQNAHNTLLFCRGWKLRVLYTSKLHRPSEQRQSRKFGGESAPRTPSTLTYIVQTHTLSFFQLCWLAWWKFPWMKMNFPAIGLTSALKFSRWNFLLLMAARRIRSLAVICSWFLLRLVWRFRDSAAALPRYSLEKRPKVGALITLPALDSNKAAFQWKFYTVFGDFRCKIASKISIFHNF